MIGMIGVLTAFSSKDSGVPMIAVLLVGIAIGLGAGALNAFSSIF